MPEVSLHIDAPPLRIWNMVSDVTRMGEWSPECYRCEWLDGASGPAVGARFKGHNKRSFLDWWTTCEVTESEPGRVFAFRIVDGMFNIGSRGREMTRWRYEFTPDGVGTNVTESNRIVDVPLMFKVIGPFLRRQNRQPGMRTTLERLKVAAEGAPATD